MLVKFRHPKIRPPHLDNVLRQPHCQRSIDVTRKGFATTAVPHVMHAHIIVIAMREGRLVLS